MKGFGWIVVGILLVVVCRARLPEGKPCNATIAWAPEVSSFDRTLVSAALAITPCGVEDYGVIKIARYSGLNETLVADPVSGQWRVQGK